MTGAIVLLTSDFNPASTGFDGNRVKRLTGLLQIIRVGTRENAILHWCPTDAKKISLDVSELRPLSLRDHNTILIKYYLNKTPIQGNSSIFKRDLRDSNLRLSGQWITAYDWADVSSISDREEKYALN